MDEKTKNNKLNESEMDEISGGANVKNLPPEIMKKVALVTTYGCPNWPFNKNLKIQPKELIKPKDTTKPEEPKKPTDINTSPNPENKN